MRSIFVTGAASGIGRATALLFAARGWRVGLFDVDERGLAAVAAEVAGEKVVGRLDVRDETSYREAVRRFGEASGGRMDALFNCAGVMRMGPFADLSAADHRLTVEVNCWGVVLGIHTALPLLRATPGAVVLTMGSASAIYGVPEITTYSASKFFVRGLTEALNLELAKDAIVVTDLMPMYVDTPMVRGQSYRAGSLRTMGAKLVPQQIAELAWRAVHGHRVHWLPGWFLKTMGYAAGALPFIARPTMRLIARL